MAQDKYFGGPWLLQESDNVIYDSGTHKHTKLLSTPTVISSPGLPAISLGATPLSCLRPVRQLFFSLSLQMLYLICSSRVSCWMTRHSLVKRVARITSTLLDTIPFLDPTTGAWGDLFLQPGHSLWLELHAQVPGLACSPPGLC